ncbi:glycosyltransferase [Azospirillum brasilense]|uniref:Glycosyltransferase subfamily 4-like N-terminal domain-containing protein n=2 Tax=Azospirillum argentinense TaxID=2970906 RepID=A0A5B0KQR5_9PROT|nr:Glycosyltransferase [Azospirillum argentinense]MBK3798712.1 glycosyltransferase [Azospirillum argentinense]
MRLPVMPPAAPAHPVPAHLLMTADSVGGVWTYALDLAQELAADGLRVTLAVLGPSPQDDQTAAARAIPGLELIDTGLPLDWMAEDPAAIRHGAEALGTLARRLEVDLVHLNSPALAADAGFTVPVVGVCHSCLATWWATLRGGALPSDFLWRIEVLARGYRACDALAAPSAAFAQATAAAYGLPPPVVVRNGRRPPPGGGPGGRERFVFTAGRLWDDGKNIATLDAAAALLKVPVVAAGSLEGPGGNRRTLRHAAALGRLDAVSVAAWLARAPVFASAALYEPFGLTVLEAAQAGCALVLSDIATFRELWDGAALFVEPRDSAALAATIRRMLDDPGEAGRLGEAARLKAGQYGMESMASGMRSLYRSVLAHHTSTPSRKEAVA